MPLGAKEKARRKKCNVRFSFARTNRLFQTKNYMRIWGEEVFSGNGPCSDTKLEVEEADGSQQKKSRCRHLSSWKI